MREATHIGAALGALVHLLAISALPSCGGEDDKERTSALSTSLDFKDLSTCEAQFFFQAMLRIKRPTRDKLFPDENTLWKALKVPVCWINPNTANAKGRELTRRAVSETWEAATGIRFVGWEKCASKDARAIRITVESTSSGAYTTGLGRELLEKDQRMVLDFGLTEWSPRCPPKASHDDCLRFIAVHEFGHALGFAHEQNREDATPECARDRDRRKGTCTVCKYDTKSVMGYCRRDWDGDVYLSECDKLAARLIYGAREDER